MLLRHLWPVCTEAHMTGAARRASADPEADRGENGYPLRRGHPRLAADPQIRRGDLLIRSESARCAFEHHRAVVDDVDAVGELKGHLGVLFDQEHADALAF